MKNITFKQFLNTYNFRNVLDSTEEGMDTAIVRIYPDLDNEYSEHRWFEFGLYDYSESSWKRDIANLCLSKEVMESYISSFYVNEKTGVLHVWLTMEKEADYY